MRPRSQTIGSLGRVPARTSKVALPPREPAPEPPPPVRVRDWIRGALLDNLGLKFVSLVLALTVFLLVKDDRDREITVRVGVLYVLPEDRVLVSERNDEVRVTIRGSWRRMRDFDERAIPRINLDLRNAPTGEIAFTTDMVEVPAGLTVVDISPRTMRVAFDRRAEKLVEVTPVVTGRPQHGYVVTEVKTAPATIKVRGAERVLAALTSVRTREITLDGRLSDFSAVGQLVPPEDVELIGSEQVEVAVRIDEELVTRKLPGVAVRVRGDGVDPARWAVTPASVEVTLTGAVLAVEKAKDLLTPSVRLAPGERGARAAEVAIDGLPPGVGVRISPERVQVAPVAAARPAATP